jgi:hypothetical protein
MAASCFASSHFQAYIGALVQVSSDTGVVGFIGVWIYRRRLRPRQPIVLPGSTEGKGSALPLPGPS